MKNVSLSGTSEGQHCADTLSRMHEVKALVNLLKRQSVGYKLVYLQFLIHVVLHQFGNTLHTLPASKGCAPPHSACDQLERSGGDLLPSSRNPDDDTFSPAFVACLQSCSHDLNISDALKGVVHASVCHLNQHLLDGLVVLFGVHTIGGSKLLGFVKLSGVDVHTYDPGRSSSLTAHDNSQTNSPQTEHSARGARLNLSGVESSSVTGGNAASEQTHFIQRRLVVDLGQRDVSHHGILREGAGAHEVKDLFSLTSEPGGLVRHQALALGHPNFLAKVGLGIFAEFAFLALWYVQRNDSVTWFEFGDPLPHTLHCPSALMAQDYGEQSLGVRATQGIGVGVTHPCGQDLNADFMCVGRGHLHFFN